MSSLTGFVKRIRDIMWNDAGVNGDAQRIEQMAWILFLKVYNTKEEEWRYTDRPYTSIIPEECRWNNWAADDKSGKAMTGDTLLDFVNNKLFPTLKGLNVTAATPIKKAIVKTTFEDANNYMKDGVLLRQVINIIADLDLDDYEEMCIRDRTRVPGFPTASLPTMSNRALRLTMPQARASWQIVLSRRSSCLLYTSRWV